MRLEQGGLDLRSPRRPFLECPLRGTGNPVCRLVAARGWGGGGGEGPRVVGPPLAAWCSGTRLRWRLHGAPSAGDAAELLT